MNKINDPLTEMVIGAVIEVHDTLGPGLLEKFYVQALSIELDKLNLEYELEKPLDIFYKGILIGKGSMDIFVYPDLIVEVKAVLNIIPVHEVQLVNYLTATKLDRGLLVNFGGSSAQFKRKYGKYKASQRN